MTVEQVWKNGFDPEGDGAEWDDPCQGNAPSCNLIASLSSSGWVCPSRVRQVPLNGTTYTGGIYGLNGGAVTDNTVTVGNLLMMGTSGLPKHGHVHPHVNPNGIADNGIFPALYEKLWMKFKTGTDYPNVNEVPAPQPWPVNREGLLAFSGWWAGGSQLYSTTWVPFDTINARCDTANGGKVRAPMVAWTKSVLPRADGFNQMVHDHVYSVLGILNPADFGGSRYIVLRNPRATKELMNGVWDPANNPQILMTTYRVPWQGYTNYEYDINGNIIPGRQLSGYAQLNVDLGVFAITNNQFKVNFDGFGWVGMP